MNSIGFVYEINIEHFWCRCELIFINVTLPIKFSRGKHKAHVIELIVLKPVTILPQLKDSSDSFFFSLSLFCSVMCFLDNCLFFPILSTLLKLNSEVCNANACCLVTRSALNLNAHTHKNGPKTC